MSAILEATIDLTDPYRTLRGNIDKELATVLANLSKRSSEFGPHSQELWKLVQSNANNGKRIRPFLIHIVADTLAPKATENTLKLGLAYELLHLGFIIHDDVIDRDELRRGVPTVYGSYVETEEIAVAAGIVSGDALISLAHTFIGQLACDKLAQARILEIFHDSIFRTTCGEFSDVVLSNESIDQLGSNEIISMLGNKTAGYTFTGPLQTAAALAGASDETITVLGALGEAMGLAFQIRDDYLGTFGNTEHTGKSTFTDIRRGRPNAVLLAAKTLDGWEELSSSISQLTITQSHDELVAKLRAMGVAEAVQVFESRQLDMAKQLTHHAAIPSRLGTKLRFVIELMSDRQS